MNFRNKGVALAIGAVLLCAPLSALAVTASTANAPANTTTSASVTANTTQLIALLQGLIALLTQELNLLLAARGQHAPAVTTPSTTSASSASGSSSGSSGSSPASSSSSSSAGSSSGSSGAGSSTSSASAKPTATLTVSPTSITSGQSATLTWSSTGATSCTGTGFAASGTSGSVSVSPTANASYSISCTGTGGSTSASANVAVSAPVSSAPSGATGATSILPIPTPTGTIYYVDYSSGSDTNNGTSQSTPWKHAPGDSNATGLAKSAKLVGGDEVLFKGGVVYQGQIDVNASGSSGHPIMFEGTGWGSGKAILSGMTSAQITFAAYPRNPAISVATLPASMIPTGQTSPILSANDNTIKVDGTIFWMTNDSTSNDMYFPDGGAITLTKAQMASEMVGSGTAWTFTDPTLGSVLAKLDPSMITNLIFRTYVYGNNQLMMYPTGFDASANALSLTGGYMAPQGSPPTYSVYNDPDFISSSNPYPEYAIEGNQFIAAVTPGVHTYELSTTKWAFNTHGHTDLFIDGFDISGYGAGDGHALYTDGATDLQFTNNTIHHLALHWGFGAQAVMADKTANLTLSGNTIGPDILYGAAIGANVETNATITNNLIDGAGWSGITTFNDVNTTVSGNRIQHLLGTHASGVIAFDPNTQKGAQQSQNLLITNNRFDGLQAGVCFEGNAYVPGPLPLPEDFTVTNNVFTNMTGPGVCNWGDTNTADVYGNIIMETPTASGLAIGPRSKDISIHNNIMTSYPYIDPKKQDPAYTITDNVALDTQYVLGAPVNGIVGFGTNNAVNTGLAPILTQALASPGVLPASICSIIMPGKSGPVGIDYSCK